MDKAKAYDEALENARKLLDKILNNELLGFPDQIREIFPQLKESNDERIRKSLIEFLTDIKRISESGRSVWAVREDDAEMCESFIAYLEKQKECVVDNTSEDEQKPTDDKAFEEWIDSWFKEHKEKAYPQITMDEKEFKNFCRGIKNMYQQKSDWNEEDEMMRENIISDLQYFRDCATDEEVVSGYNDEIAWLKDISLNHKKFTEAVYKLWSNDWSEEDKEALDMCLDVIPKKWKTKSGILLTKWLKDNIHLQSKQDWSEEDEKTINDACCFLGEYAGYIGSKNWGKSSMLFSIVDKLKSLRPQSKKELSIEKAIQWLDDTFYFLDNSSGRGRDCEITTHDFDSLEEMYDSFCKAVTVDSEPHWKPSKEQQGMEPLTKLEKAVFDMLVERTNEITISEKQARKYAPIFLEIAKGEHWKSSEDKELLKNILFQKKGITYDDYKYKNNPYVGLYFDELIKCLEEYDKERSNR